MPSISTSVRSSRVIATLEKIKTEASEIMQKVEETDVVLNEVEKVSHEYLPMAKACSSIFFTLSSLSTVGEYHLVPHSNTPLPLS